MREKNSKLSTKNVLRSAALTIGYYVLMVVAYLLWITGGNSLFHAHNPQMFVWFFSIALILGATIGMASKCKSSKETS